MLTAHVWGYDGRVIRRRRFETEGEAHAYARGAFKGKTPVREVTITREGKRLRLDEDGFTKWGPVEARIRSSSVTCIVA